MKTNRVTGTLHEDQCTFLLLSPSFLLKLKKFQTSCRENRNTHFIFNDFFENRAFYEIMWKNVEEPGRSQVTIWRMRVACWISKATITYSEYVMLIVFPQQQWLQERASVVRYPYSTLPVLFIPLFEIPSLQFSSIASRTNAALITYSVRILACMFVFCEIQCIAVFNVHLTLYGRSADRFI